MSAVLPVFRKEKESASGRSVHSAAGTETEAALRAMSSAVKKARILFFKVRQLFFLKAVFQPPLQVWLTAVQSWL